jgi:ribose transport system ATP-binding protein
VTNTVLAARGLSKHYGSTRALRGVDLDIRLGEVVGLAGENGSGKSTLAKVLAGVLRADAGTIAVDGQEEHEGFRRPLDALQRGIALVSQEPVAVPHMSIAENVFLASLRRVSALVRHAELAVRTRPLLKQVGVEVDPSATFSSLKPGDRELVEVARALASHPRVLILDETTSRLAERDAARLFAVVRRLKQTGTSTILITHRLSELADVADRVVVLRDGERVGEVARGEATQRRLSSMMVGREIDSMFEDRSRQRHPVVLECHEVVSSYWGHPVTFDVHGGEIVGLAGLIGCGNTELLEAIAGLRPFTAGRLLVNGVDVQPGVPRKAIEQGAVLVPEDRLRQGLVPTAPVWWNIAMPLWRSNGLAFKERDRRVAAPVIEQLSIKTGDFDAPVTALSGGNQQKVVFGRWMALNKKPKVLLLDEPTRGVDVSARQEIYRVIHDLADDGLGVLVASPELRELLGLASRILVMHEGRIVADLPKATASEDEIVFFASGGKETE